MKDAWSARLPADVDQLLPWLIALPAQDLTELVALTVAASLNTSALEDNDFTGAKLAGVLDLNMADWWTPTVDGYLKHIPKVKVLAAVATATTDDNAKSMAAMKKPELVIAAERALSGTRWLPNMFKA